eukprot:Phypoly_transcript_11710.p1 GENE.Phypoly_transcript_11710~~Phypoly_transcript_11710.p1  ORF type:complete len:241 (+),score=36.40 Phypoly_transcript_11710:84-806(+)
MYLILPFRACICTVDTNMYQEPSLNISLCESPALRDSDVVSPEFLASLFGDSFNSLHDHSLAPPFGAITPEEVILSSTVSEASYLPFYQISFPSSPVSPPPASVIPILPNHPNMASETCTYPSPIQTYVPPSPPEPCSHCPNLSCCFQTIPQTSLPEYHPSLSCTWTTTLTVDTTLCTLPDTPAQIFPNLVHSYSSPPTPVLSSPAPHKHHPYPPKPRARSHSPPTVKKLRPTPSPIPHP